MFERLRGQVQQFVADRRVRPRLNSLEERTVLSTANGQLLDLWFNGTYGMNTLGSSTATVGLSTINPTTGAEQILFSETAPIVNGVAINTLKLAQTPDGKPLLFAGKPVVYGTKLPAVTDTGMPGAVSGADLTSDSTISILDGTGSRRVINRPYVIQGVGRTSDGNLLVSWADQSAGTNPYEIGNINVGISSFNPSTGIEQTLVNLPMPRETGPINGLPPMLVSLQFDAEGLPLMVSGKYVMMGSRAGVGSYYAATDDTSAIWLVDTATQAATKYAMPRETLEVMRSPDGALYASWSDSTYGMNPYGTDSTTLGLSRLDPTTLAETVLIARPIGAQDNYVTPFDASIVLSHDGRLLMAGGRPIVAVHEPGSTLGTVSDNRTALYALNTGTQAPKLLRTDSRDLRQIGVRSDGSLLVNWTDGTYGNNPYGNPSSVVQGISRIDPNTGAETKLFTTPVTTYNIFGPNSPLPIIDLLIEDSGRIPTVGNRTIASISTFGTTFPTAMDESSQLMMLNDNGTPTKLPASPRRIDNLGVSGDGGVLVGWYDGSFSTNPYGQSDSAIRGVSRIDPATGAEQKLFQENVPVRTTPGYQPVFADSIEFVTASNGLPYLTGGKPMIHHTEPGAVGYGDPSLPWSYNAPKDDFSEIIRLNGIMTTTLQSKNRESLLLVPIEGLAVSPPTVPPNTAPTISAIADRSTTMGKSVGPITFSIGDAETPNSLTVTAASSNPALVSSNQIAFGGSGANRTVTINPAASKTGTAMITLTVTDPSGATVTESFSISVPAVSKLIGTAREFAVGSDAGIPATVRFYNSDRTERFSVTPFGSSFTGGIRTASADVNGDGIADVIAASGPGIAGRVVILDGVNQQTLFDLSPFGSEFTLGVVVAAGDMTNDGKAEIVITAESGGGARVRIFTPSASGFVQKTDFFGLLGGDGIADTTFRGGSRATVGDVNGDGFGDLIFAAGAGGGPRIAIFDGKQLGASGGPKLRGDFFAFEPDLRDGTYVAAGDFDGDGKVELVAGAGPGGGPRVTIFSGADLTNNVQVKLRDFFAGDLANRGGIRVAVKDLDGDSKADLLVGTGPGGGMRATAYSGNSLFATSAVSFFDLEIFNGSSGVYVG